jgi:hypothetical protein
MVACRSLYAGDPRKHQPPHGALLPFAVREGSRSEFDAACAALKKQEILKFVGKSKHPFHWDPAGRALHWPVLFTQAFGPISVHPRGTSRQRSRIYAKSRK